MATALSFVWPSGRRAKQRKSSGDQSFEPSLRSRSPVSQRPPWPRPARLALACRVRRVRQVRMIGKWERALHGCEIAADDFGGKTRVREFRVVLEQANGGVPRPHVRGAAADVMIGAGVLEETIDQVVGRGRLGGARCEQLLERGPAGEAVLAGDGELYVAQRRCAGRVLDCALEAGARIGGVPPERAQPALRFLLEIVEGGPGRDTPGHALLPLCLASADNRPEEGSKILLTNQHGWE